VEIRVSPFAKNIYAQIEETGTAGFNPERVKFGGIEKALKELKDYILVLSAETVIAKTAAEKCIALILTGKKSGDEITLAAARQKSGLTRRVLIPLLEYLDAQGKTVRKDSGRFVR
jgi:selenocysteine-specific elongation factor